MICPHCGSEIGGNLGVEKGGLSLLPDFREEKTSDPDKETPKKGVRGRAREYTQAFELAWKAYGRKDQKFEAFGVWLAVSKEIGGEPQLLTLILAALKWQTPIWAPEGWKFAPYFERYLKRRKWEDEPLPASAGAPLLRPAPAPRPQWAIDKDAKEARAAAAEEARKKAAAEAQQARAQKPSMCGWHLYGGEGGWVREESCTKLCPRYGDQDGKKAAR